MEYVVFKLEVLFLYGNITVHQDLVEGSTDSELGDYSYSLFSCVSLHGFRTKDCTWLSRFACLLVCSSGKLSICSSRFLFPPAICEKCLLVLAVSLCLLKQWLLYNFFLHCRAFKTCSLCPGQVPKLSIPHFSHLQGPNEGSWEWKVCVEKQIYLSIWYPLDQVWILS